MFSYIEHAGELTQDMVNQYNSSLIFLGDEKQIFVPIINSYVGLGQSAYSYILNKFKSTDTNFDDYNNYIHNDTVTSIYAQFNPSEIKQAILDSTAQTPHVTLRGIDITSDEGAETIFKANKNVIIKGLNQYNDFTNTNDTDVLSGIDVSIKHNGNVQQGNYVFNGKTYSYTYYAPYDIITVDDSKTWAYIGRSNTYMAEFVTKFATQQANRVYKNLLGESDSYVEKQFDEAFRLDPVTGQLTEFEDVYVKWNDGNDTYKSVTVINTDNGYRIVVDGDNTIVYSTISGDTIGNGNNNDPFNGVLSPNGGYWTGTNGSIPYWYHLVNNGSNTINIADGIQTIREVAYILDQITDGEDDGAINLAYNISYNYIEIQNLKKWQGDIGNQTVSAFKSSSDTDLLTVHYYSDDLYGDKDRDADGFAVGKVKLDLDLTMAQTYTLNGITYAAYLTSGQVPDDQLTYFAKHEDDTNSGNYISLYDSAKANTSYTNLQQLISKQNPGIDPADYNIPIYEITKDNGGNVIDIQYSGSTVKLNQLAYTSADNLYIYFPYTESNYVFNKGLTDVNWVTTYVGWTAYNIISKINAVNTDLNDLIQTKLDDLDVPDYSYSYLGQFVTKVEETNGKISVTREKLPLDSILKNDINTTGEVYVHISVAEALELFNDSKTIYIYDNGYAEVQNNSIFGTLNLDSSDVHNDLNDCSIFYRKTSVSNMTVVPVDTSVDTLLTNAGNTTYFYKESVTSGDYYLPLDIQAENKNGGLLANAKVATANTIYYLSGSLHNVKYFDVNTILQKNGSTTTIFTSYITPLAAASSTNTGLADAWDVRRTIESMFTWVNIKTNTIIG